MEQLIPLQEQQKQVLTQKPIHTPGATETVQSFIKPLIVSVAALLADARSLPAQPPPLFDPPPAPAPEVEPPPLPGPPNPVPQIIRPLFPMFGPRAAVAEVPVSSIENVLDENELCVLRPYALTPVPQYDKADALQQETKQYASLTAWQAERYQEVLKTLEGHLVAMDDDNYFVRAENTKAAIQCVALFLDECNPPPQEVREFLSRHRQQASLKTLSLEQRKRLEKVENAALGASMVRVSMIPASIRSGTELISFLENTMGVTLSFENEDVRLLLESSPVSIMSGNNEFTRVFAVLCNDHGLVPVQSAPLQYHLRLANTDEYVVQAGACLAVVRPSATAEYDIDVLHDPSGAMIAIQKAEVCSQHAGEVRAHIHENSIAKWESEDGSTNLKRDIKATQIQSDGKEYPGYATLRVIRAYAPVTETIPTDTQYHSRFGVQYFMAANMPSDDRLRLAVNVNVVPHLEWPKTSVEADTWTYRLVDSTKFAVKHADGTLEKVVPEKLFINRRDTDVTMYHDAKEPPKEVQLTAFSAMKDDILIVPLGRYAQEKNPSEK